MAKKAASTAASKKANDEEPNVVWRGKKEPPESIQVGMDTINLPDAETQKTGFYHPDPQALHRLKNGYKELKPKG